MNTSTRRRLGRLVPILALALAGPGCSGGSDTVDAGRPPKTQTAPARPGLAPVVPHGDVIRKEVARHVWFETEGKQRRVRVEASVCLRKGEYGLECLLCRTKRKEYESLLATSALAFDIHKALVAAGAEYGSPVRFDGTFKPPTGSRVRVSVEYEDQGKLVTAPAGYWVRDVRTKKELDSDWVFAGSLFWPNPDGDDKPKLYAADSEGGYVYLVNMPTAMLDLPVHTPSAPEQRSFEPFTEHIPEVGTPAVVIFEPVPGSGGAKSTEKN